MIRVAGYTASAFTHPLGDWALKQGYKKIATISQDYTFGHEQCGGFAQVFTEGGGEIVQQFWHPLNTADFSPYLGQLADLKVDAIFAMETGADSTRFIQQYASFGLKAKTPLLDGDERHRPVGDPHHRRGMRRHHLAGAFRGGVGQSGHRRSSSKDYEAKYGKIPSLYGFSMYSGMMWIDAALKKMGGKVEDREVFIDTVLKTELDGSPLGKAVKLDAYGNPIYDVYIRKVVKRADGKFWNVPIHDLSECLAVLEIRSGDLPEAAALFAHLPGHQEEPDPSLTSGRGPMAASRRQSIPWSDGESPSAPSDNAPTENIRVRTDPDADRCCGRLRRAARGRRRQPVRAARPASRHHRS